MGRRAESTLDNPLVLKTVHKGMGFLLSYRGCGDEAETLWMNCISQGTPKIGDESVDYNCPAMNSPYLQGASGSGVSTLTGPVSGKKVVFDFNKIERGGGE